MCWGGGGVSRLPVPAFPHVVTVFEHPVLSSPQYENESWI